MTPTPVETSEQIERAASVWAVRERPLSAADETALRVWLAGDPRRRGALLRAEAAWAGLSRAQALGPSATWPGEHPGRDHAPVRRHFLMAAGGLTAASVLAVIGLRPHDTVTRVGEVRRLPMNDGSIATLNTDSRLRIDMTKHLRRIELVEGEAWFKVARNKTRPFVVSAGRVRIKAVGTAFSVKKRDGGAEVLVTEGTVVAWSTGRSQTPVRLTAGNRAFISHDGAAEVAHTPDDIDGALAWREGQIALNGKTLADVAAELNRFNRTKIVIQDPELAGEKLIGRLSANDPEAFSSAVVQAFNAKVSRTETTIFIGEKK